MSQGFKDRWRCEDNEESVPPKSTSPGPTQAFSTFVPGKLFLRDLKLIVYNPGITS